MTKNVLSPDTLNVYRILSAADPDSVQRGRGYYHNRRARIENVGAHDARLLVQGTQPTPYQVHVGLDAGVLTLSCSCPLVANAPLLICKHKIAAVLTLQDHLRAHPVQTWETALAQTLQTNGRRATTPAKSVLFFSLQKRSSSWGLYVYSLPASHFADAAAIANASAVAQAVAEGKLSAQAQAVRARIDAKRFVNLTPANQAVAQIVAMAQQYPYYYYGSDRTLAYETLFPQLAGSLVYQGSETNPLQKPLRIVAEKGRPEIEIQETPEGLHLVPRVHLGEEIVRLLPTKAGGVVILSDDPLWVIFEATLLAMEDPTGTIATLLQQPDLVIPPADRTVFVEQYLLPIAERVPLVSDAFAWDDVHAPPAPRVYLSETDGQLRAQLRFGYDAFEVLFERHLPLLSLQHKPDTTTLARVYRQPEEEARWSKTLNGFGLKRGTEPDTFVLRAQTEPVDFLLHQVPHLAEAGFEVYGEQALTSGRVNRNRPTLSLVVSSEIDWFDVKAVVHFGETAVSLKAVRAAVRKRERYVKLGDGSIGVVPPEWIERYRHLWALGEETETGVRLSSHHLTLLDQVLQDADQTQTDAEFEKRKQRLRTFSEITPHALPSGFVGELRPYQKAGYDWLHFLHEYEWGGCLADDMGTGKTVQALAFLLSHHESGHAETADLIVMPRSLLFNWQREAARFTPGLRVLVYADADRPKDVAEFANYDLVLTTYGVLLRDIERLRAYRFHYAVLDEAQAVKNPLSQTGGAVRLLGSDHRLTLTGTPVENSTLELWSQFAFLNPGLLGNLETFRGEFAGAIERKQDEHSAQLLRRLVHPFILRRTKDQVAPELPPRTERLLFTEMEPAQRALYDQWRDHYRAQLLKMIDDDGMNNARMKVLEGLLRLRQICNHPHLIEPGSQIPSGKFELLLETLETLHAEGHKALVFSQFVQMLKLVRGALDARNIPYTYLDGSTKDRQTPVDTFQTNPDIPFFLISLRAGGVGLNLTAADYVIHIDPWWNPAVEMQATDRTHRIGQDKPVFVYKLIARDSVEEKILLLQDRKRALVSQLIATEGGLFKSLTRQDIEGLFQ